MSHDYKLARERMVKNQLIPRGIADEHVLRAMGKVQRHLFVEEALVGEAYNDHPLPIGHKQTISQPYIVALMTEMLGVSPDHKVLEVGTGSGYQAAVLSHLVQEVYTVEIIEPLGRTAAERLKRLGYGNVHVQIGDGYYGWEEHAPFDRVIVTCAATLVPPPLLKQLKSGGKMCLPVGGHYAVQYLTMVEKSPEGRVTMRKELPVRFVPMTRGSE